MKTITPYYVKGILICFFSCFLIQSVYLQDVAFIFDAEQQGTEIRNKGTDINFWSTDSWQSAKPSGYYSTYFPFVERVQIMAAIGGNDDRDLFIDPQNTSTMTDYDFTKLVTACQNIVDQGLKPCISLSWVPQKFSSSPSLGSFGTNVRPPSDYDDWYNYISACLQELVNVFGIDEVITWSWCVGVEFENDDWFDDGFLAYTTRIAFYKLYDYAVAALESVLGADNVFVGAHSMTCADGYWNELQFIDHCVTGTNYVTSEQGTQLDFYQISYYDSQAEGFDGTNFIDQSYFIKDHLDDVGLTDLPFGVGEGRVLNGWDDKPLNPREVLHPIQGSMDAKKCILMIENNIDWFSHWGCQAGMTGNKPVNLIGASVYNLFYKMTGGSLLGKTSTGAPADANNEVEAIAGLDESINKLCVIVYNNNPDKDAQSSETVNINIGGVEYVSGDSVQVCSWFLDAYHANFWDEWYDAQVQNGLTDDDFYWSRHAIGSMSTDAWNVWNANIGQYQTLSMLDSTVFSDEIINDTLSFDISLAHHGVVLYEISNIKVVSTVDLPDESCGMSLYPLVYPNPFNEEIRVAYSLNRESNVKISIISSAGRHLNVLSDKRQAEGSHTEVFNTGEWAVNNGIYIVEVNIDGHIYTEKVIMSGR